MNQQINTGYIAKPHLPEHEEKLGDVWAVQNPSGDWSDYIPPQIEQQNIGVEPMCCTAEGDKGAVEVLTSKQYGDTTLLSARLLAKLSNTTTSGNDPMTVLTTLATKGTVPEAEWPNTAALTTWEQFYADPPQSVIDEALLLPLQYTINGRWIGTDIASLKAGLTISPTGISGYAWAQDANGLYYSPPGAPFCHWFLLIDIIDDPTQPNGIKYKIFDSYEQDIKYLRGDYVFGEAMQYQVIKNVGNTPAEQSAWQKFLSFFNLWIQQTFGFGEYGAERLGGASRSPQWEEIKREFAKYVPKVDCFDGSKLFIQLHHSQDPFHSNPARELDPTQLRWVGRRRHLEEGHNGNFQSLNFSFDQRVEDYQNRKFWNGTAWVVNDKPRIKYKLTEQELQIWNQKFGTNWEYL